MTNKIFRVNQVEPEIIPAILENTSEKIVERIHQLETISSLVELIQLDLADGLFVKNKTPLPGELPSLPKTFRYIFHLMVEEPEKYKEDLKKFEPETIIFHLEASKTAEKTLKALKEIGKTGIAINPETSPEKLLEVGEKLNEILVMTVKPGFAGQTFIKGSGEKIKQTKKLFPETKISVDGGIQPEYLPEVLEAGAERIYVSSYLFKGGSTTFTTGGKIELNFKKLLDCVNRQPS